MVELSHDSRPIIGRGPPLIATFITLAIASIALMVTDQRYDQLERVRAWLTAAAYPVQVAVDAPFRAWNWLTGSFADRDRLRQENLEVTARLRLANLQLQRFARRSPRRRRTGPSTPSPSTSAAAAPAARRPCCRRRRGLARRVPAQ